MKIYRIMFLKKKGDIEKLNIENDKLQKDIEKHKEEILDFENEILEVKKKDPKKMMNHN